MFAPQVQSNIHKAISEFAFAGLATGFKIGCQIASTNFSMASKALEATRHLQEAFVPLHNSASIENKKETAKHPSSKSAKSANGKANGHNGHNGHDKTSSFPTPFWFFPLANSINISDKNETVKKSEGFTFTPFPLSPFLKMFENAYNVYKVDTPFKSLFTPFIEPAWNFYTQKAQSAAIPTIPGFNFPNFNFPGMFPGLNFDPFNILKNSAFSNPFKVLFPFQDSPKPAHLFQPHHVLPWAMTMPINTPFSAPLNNPFASFFPNLAQAQRPIMPSWPFAQPENALKGFMMLFPTVR